MKKVFRLLSLLVLCSCLLLACEKEPEEEDPLEILTNEFCEDACTFANDGECDDGGANSSSNFCEYGTDCTDCGLRTLVEVVD